jgi:hypothetical protein
LRPGEGGRRGWRGEARRCASGVEVLLDLLQRRTKKGHEEVRLVEGKRIEERGRSRAHRWWRNWPDELADAAVSDERLRRFGGVSVRRTKGRWRRVAGSFYSRDGVEEGLGFRPGGGDRTLAGADVHGEDFLARWR